MISLDKYWEKVEQIRKICLLVFISSHRFSKQALQSLLIIKVTILNERDIAGLQYLGGYVLHKLHRKHAKANTKESQQAMAILKAGKLEESTHGATTQKLITSLNRGGLWSITMPTQRIFVKIEKHFRLLTPNKQFSKMSIKSNKTFFSCHGLNFIFDRVV